VIDKRDLTHGLAADNLIRLQFFRNVFVNVVRLDPRGHGGDVTFVRGFDGVVAKHLAARRRRSMASGDFRDRWTGRWASICAMASELAEKPPGCDVDQPRNLAKSVTVE